MTDSPITFRDYPYWPAKTEEDIKDQLQLICNLRKDDITQINNLVNTFIGGRKVGKIPTGSSDVAATDRLGDINYTTTFLYILVDNAGTAVWRRVALSSW